MIPYRDEKIKNAIAFFTERHLKKTKHRLYQTFLFKYLAFFDFWSLRETGRPALELVYKAMKRGPVPVEIYENKANTRQYNFDFVKDEYGEFVAAPGKADLSYFSGSEIELMERLIEIFAQGWITANIMSDASHEDIKAWKRTWHTRPNTIIDYALEFNGDVSTKKYEELTFPEEAYLTHKALNVES